MDKRHDIEEQMEAALNSLDGLQKAGPGPFFITRVQARLNREIISPWARIASFMTRPSVALATFCLIFLLNAAALFYRQPDNTGSVADQLEQSGGDEYNTTLAANSYYDENSDVR